MRIIIISDIHANMLALESVMKKIRIHRPDVVVCLGDLVGYGPHPNEVLEYMRSSDITCTLGGADERLAYDFARDKRPRVGVADKTLDWTRTVVEEANLAYLRDLPLQARVNTPFGRLRFFHASMESTQRTVHFAKDPIPEKEFRRHRAKIIAHGKTHVPQIRKGPFGVVVNPGSVGLSLNGEPGADYALLDISEDKVDVTMDKVEYDFAAVAFEIAGWELPAVVGEAVQQGRMPMEDTSSQRDPSKVRIQTKVVVGRQGRSDNGDNDKTADRAKGGQETVEVSSKEGTAAAEDAMLVNLAPAFEAETQIGSAQIGLAQVDLAQVDLAQVDLAQGSSVQGDVAVPSDTLGNDFEAASPDEEDAHTTLASVTARVQAESKDDRHEDDLSVEDEFIVLPADDDSDNDSDDGGMLNLDAIGESEKESEESSIREDAPAMMVIEDPDDVSVAAVEADSSSPASGSSAQEARQTEAHIDKKVEEVMLELQRQLKTSFENSVSDTMTEEEKREAQKSALNLEALKSLILEQAAQQAAAATASGTASGDKTEEA